MMLRSILCNVLAKRVLNRNLSTFPQCETTRIKIGIVGSGPAAFYTAHFLLAKNPNVCVDMFEKYPVPFGLVRFGVSPDHQDVKNVIASFTKIADSERFRLYGNVTVGKDVLFKELISAYNVIVLAYGADEERHLGIPGEDLKNVFSARQFVGWYNGVPELSHLNPDLNVETAVVIGHGNVALDVARILITPLEILKKSDITRAALEVLDRSKIKKVWLIGRRGPLQAAFTTKELREMTQFPNCGHCVDATDFEVTREKLSSLARPRKRLTELMMQLTQQQSNKSETFEKIWGLKFLRSPLKIVGGADQNVESIVFSINKLEGEDENAKVVSTDSTETISCGLVLKSIGFKSIPIDPDIPFDHKKGIIENDNGKVKGIPGVYCSGWVQRGPVGVIVHTMNGGLETAERILEDIKTGSVNLDSKQGSSLIDSILLQRGIDVVDFQGWMKIDEKEKAEGEKVGKPREKITSIAEMVKIAKMS